MSTDENPQRENEMDTPSFEALHAHIFKLKDGDKKTNKANTRVVCIVSCSKIKQNKKYILVMTV